MASVRLIHQTTALLLLFLQKKKAWHDLATVAYHNVPQNENDSIHLIAEKTVYIHQKEDESVAHYLASKPQYSRHMLT